MFNFLHVTLKVHQILALVDVNFEDVFSTDTITTRSQKILLHFNKVVDQLTQKDGLNYVPRERTREGRLFEHAADSRVLVNHLTQLDESQSKVSFNEREIAYFIKIVDEKSKDSKPE